MMNTISHLRSAAIFSLLWIACLNLQAQITTDNSLTPEELVPSWWVLGFRCPTSPSRAPTLQRGSFVNNNGNLTIGEGIVLSTGNIALMAGPNTTGAQVKSLRGGGYPDLTTLGGQTSHNDAAILEIRFHCHR